MGDERLGMSLNDIIIHKEERNKKTSASLNVRGNANGRNQRHAAPYDNSGSRQTEKKGFSSFKHEVVAIKFLLTHHLSGSLIGIGGGLIKELMEITGASIHVSSSNEHYPGTQFRTIYITGSEGQVSLAQSLMWELIGQQTQTLKQTNDGTNTAVWNPTFAYRNPGRYDNIEVEGRITIPAHAAGAVFGKGGVSIRAIGDSNRVVIAMSSKEEGELTRERIITISGTVSGCMGATANVLQKMAEEEDGFRFVCNGTAYSQQSHDNAAGRETDSHRGGGGGRNDRDDRNNFHRNNHRDNNNHRGGNDNRGGNSFLNAGRNVREYGDNNRGNDRDYGRSNDNNSSYAYGRGRAASRGGYDDEDRQSHAGRSVTGDFRHNKRDYANSVNGGGGVGSDFNLGAHSFEGIAETLSANTVIELAVPDTLIGAILGPQGATLNEIVNLSGAKITVSKRGERTEVVATRVVSITGPPASAQTAHTLVVHKLRQFSAELADNEA